MRFKVDENLPVEVAELPRDAGYQADIVLDENLGGARDESIADRCIEEDRVIVTLDQDFANIRAYPPAEPMGLVSYCGSRISASRTSSLSFTGYFPCSPKSHPAVISGW